MGSHEATAVQMFLRESRPPVAHLVGVITDWDAEVFCDRTGRAGSVRVDRVAQRQGGTRGQWPGEFQSATSWRLAKNAAARVVGSDVVAGRGELIRGGTVQATFGFSATVLAEASLSFLGLGPGASAPWGALLDQGTAHLLRTPRLAMLADALIAATVLGFNLTDDWLRDRLDPCALCSPPENRVFYR